MSETRILDGWKNGAGGGRLKPFVMRGRTVNVYSDGKLGRGTKGEILRNESKRIFIKYYDAIDELWVEGWFVRDRRENGGAFWHKDRNMWFYPCRETEKFKTECKEWITTEYWKRLFAA